MSAFKSLGDKADTFKIPIRYDEAVALEQGTPVVFVMDGTDDGLAVVLPSTAGAAKSTMLFAGIVSDRAPNDGAKMGQAQIFGFCRRTKILRMTRAATTD